MKFNFLSNAKINLGLNVIEKLENGYHLLDMIMVPITLADSISGEIFDCRGELEIRSNNLDIPTDKRNILYKIYDKFYEKSGLEKRKIEIYLEKIVPFEAGLGGGSSNGGFFLLELNKYHNNYFSMENLLEIGKSVGADIPFFIINKSARVRGIGEDIQKIENNLKYKIILIKPPFGVSTGKAYQNMSIIKNKKYADIENIVKALKNNDVQLLEKSIENNLEQGLLVEDKNIIDFRDRLKKIDRKFFMSGSGSAYYTFVDEDNATEEFDKIRLILEDCKVYLTECIL